MRLPIQYAFMYPHRKNNKYIDRAMEYSFFKSTFDSHNPNVNNPSQMQKKRFKKI